MLLLYRFLFNNIGAEGLLFSAFGITVEETEDTFAIAPQAGFIILCVIAFAWMIASYFLGSINFAIVISKLRHRDDIRNHGSNNAGATNMLRTYGAKDSILTVVGDVSKAVVAVLTARFMLGINVAYYCALLCVIGHCFPVYYGFKGGKGVTVSLTSFVMLDPILGVIILLIFALLVLGTKYVSLGSVLCALLYPVLLDRYCGLLFRNGVLAFNHPSGPMIIASILIAALVTFMHRNNIKRLMEGKETKLILGKKNKEREAERIRAEKSKDQSRFSLHNIDDDDDKGDEN